MRAKQAICKLTLGAILGSAWLLSGCSNNNNIDNVLPANQAPVALNDTFVLPVATGAGAPNVLANDTDDGPHNELSAQLGSSPSPAVCGNAFVLAADGSFTCNHTATDPRSGAFTYQAADGQGGASSNVATATITFNSNPTPQNDGPVAIPFKRDATTGTNNSDCTMIGVLQNDTDPDEGDTATLKVISVVPATGSTATGQVTGNGAAICVRPGDDGTPATLRYTVQDRFGGTASADVFVTIRSGGDAALVAENDVFSVPRGGTLTIGRGGVLVNDTVDGQAVPTAEYGSRYQSRILSGPDHSQNATFVLNPDGSFTYRNDGQAADQDQFQYILQDTGANPDSNSDDRVSEPATVTIIIDPAPANLPPVAGNDSANLTRGPSQRVDIPILYNDSDPDDGVVIFNGIVAFPADGTVDTSGLASFGIVRYTRNSNPDVTLTGDRFDYEIKDSRGATMRATVQLQFVNGPDRAPVAAADVYSVPADRMDFTFRPTSNDSDPDGDNVILALVDGKNAAGTRVETATKVAFGTTSFDPKTGVARYIPPATNNFTPPQDDVFEYTVVDGRGLVSRADITIHVTPAINNRAPVACDDNPLTGDGNIAAATPPCVNHDFSNNLPNLFDVPACGLPIRLDVLVNDTDLDPADRPNDQPFADTRGGVRPGQGVVPNPDEPPTMSGPPVDPIKETPRGIGYAMIDSNGGNGLTKADGVAPFTVGSLRITSAPTVTHDDAGQRQGQVTIAPDGTHLIYRHVGSQQGCVQHSMIEADKFDYVVSDGHGGSDVGTVTVRIIPAGVPAGPNDDLKDADSDGVRDLSDRCASSDSSSDPAGPVSASNPVFANGCPLNEQDRDRDNVVEPNDKCPLTPRGTIEDFLNAGCPLGKTQD